MSAKFTYDFANSFSSIKCKRRVRVLQRTQFCQNSTHDIDNANNGKVSHFDQGLLLCLVLLQVPIFWASPKIWLHLVPIHKLLCRHKNQLYWMQIIFLSGTKCLWPNKLPICVKGWFSSVITFQNKLFLIYHRLNIWLFS